MNKVIDNDNDTKSLSESEIKLLIGNLEHDKDYETRENAMKQLCQNKIEEAIPHLFMIEIYEAPLLEIPYYLSLFGENGLDRLFDFVNSRGNWRADCSYTLVAVLRHFDSVPVPTFKKWFIKNNLVINETIINILVEADKPTVASFIKDDEVMKLMTIYTDNEDFQPSISSILNMGNK